jgi:hypothetical protein
MRQFFSNFFLFVLLFQSTLFLRAEEGMLIPSLIAAFESDMRAKGMRLTADDIYSVNKASIKDAILHFGGGCTAELVSNQGLLLTNHHCGYSQIQYHSSLEKDYLKNGFWAKNKSDELPNPGLTATRIVRIEDVTAAVFSGGTDKNNLEAIRLAIKKLTEAAVAGTHYEAEIKPFNYGNDYYMLVREVFKDVRLVGTPPNSIGKFGGDTDNWVWPRHTGDFSVFRVYAGKDNKPAAFSKDNVPYQPLHFLPISFKDRKAGDFTMVYGFPGVTEQHVVSGYLKFIVEKERPARIKMRDLSLSVINEAMRNSDMVRIQYSAKQASIANAWKKWIGQIQGLKELNAYQIKLDYEKRYTESALSKPEWKKYSDIVAKMNQLVEQSVNHEFSYAMGVEYLSVGPEYFRLARSFNEVLTNFASLKANNTLESALEKLKSGAESFFKNYDAQVDRGIFELQTVEYFKQIGWSEKVVLEVYVKTLTDNIYKSSIFTNKERYLKAVNSLNEKAIKKLNLDQGLAHYVKTLEKFRSEVIPANQTFQTEMTALLKTYVEGKYAMFPDDKHWPDANSTLRITYGQLEGSCPVDGMCYTEHTTLDGIIAKNKTGNPDFELLPRMLELHAKKQYGPYAQEGKLWVCFSGSNHTTGGNSGSPVLDANGHLMGLNFDRSWESTMSDYLFDSSRCRNIVVDIRYVLWVMDIYSDAKHLVDEMVLVKE